MTTPTPPPAPSAAIAAFLRGLDRRARLLALVQSGDAAATTRALDVAARVFATEAGQWPIAQWPRQYWRLLLSTPSMRQASPAAAGPLPGVARLPPQVRAALLLHLVAALEDADAAAALGIDMDTYQQRIRDALPRDALNQPDLDVWRAWRAAAQRALEAMPEAAADTPVASELPVSQIHEAGDAARHRRRMRWLWLGVALCAVALVASFFLHPRGRELLDQWRNHVQVAPLPPAAAPKARFDPVDPALHPDRELLAEPGTVQLARRLPLLAWLAAEAPDALPAPLAPAFADHASAVPADAPPAASLSERMRAWGRLSPQQRAQQRGALAEWQALPADEQALLRRLAARFAALPLTEQQALRERYAALSFDAQRGWHLGPRLGRDWPRIGALFAYVEPGERDALLCLLRAASAEELDTLARLAQITPPEARAALRRGLLAQLPAQRTAWLQARLQP